MLAFLLDFDGLILDTESCALTSWTEEYAYYGLTLSLDDWHAELGVDIDHDSRFAVLERLADPDRWAARNSRESRRRRHLELIGQLDAQRGVRRFVQEASARGHPLAVVSGSPSHWVRGHLARLGLESAFRVLVTGDEVDRGKPAPDLYELALSRLVVGAPEAVAFEDAQRGVAAAVAAGVTCIAVPNPVTAGHDFAACWFVAGSFEDDRVRGLIGRGGRARPT